MVSLNIGDSLFLIFGQLKRRVSTSSQKTDERATYLRALGTGGGGEEKAWLDGGAGHAARVSGRGR